MISVNDLRVGTTFEENENIFRVLSFEHIKMGRGSASIKIKAKNLRSGAIVEKGYTNGQFVREADLQKSEYQFLYRDEEYAYFMDPVSFEQRKIPLGIFEKIAYLKEGGKITLELFNNEPVDLILPPKMALKIVECAPGVRGDSASNVYKTAVLENGMNVRVPLFIKPGDMIVVDTRDGSYTKRA